jgi:hypothetical protein
VISDWWMVLDRSGERILHRSTSRLEAFRVARRRTGGAVRLTDAEGFGVSVLGRRGTLTVIQVTGGPDRRARVAIPIALEPHMELVRLPDGGSFTWIPSDMGVVPTSGRDPSTPPARLRGR